MKIIFWIAEESTPLSSTETVVEVVREHVRLGQLTMAIGVSVFILFLILAELTELLSQHLSTDSQRGLGHHGLGGHVASSRCPPL